MSTPSIRFVDGDGDGDRAGDRDGAGPKALYSFNIHVCSRIKINKQSSEKATKNSWRPKLKSIIETS